MTETVIPTRRHFALCWVPGNTGELIDFCARNGIVYTIEGWRSEEGPGITVVAKLWHDGRDEWETLEPAHWLVVAAGTVGEFETYDDDVFRAGFTRYDGKASL